MFGAPFFRKRCALPVYFISHGQPCEAKWTVTQFSEIQTDVLLLPA